jgi:hypothetical protein
MNIYTILCAKRSKLLERGGAGKQQIIESASKTG